MEDNYNQERLLEIYKKLYQYRDMLKNGPTLSFDVNAMDEGSVAGSFDAINAQLSQAISYLLGLQGKTLTVEAMLDSLIKHYTEDDFWRRLLLDYIEICQEADEAEVAQKKKEVAEHGKDLYEKIRAYQQQRKELIRRFSGEIEPQKFPINAERLFKNYLRMADLDPKKAWDVLITNPAFFSPIVVEDKDGNRILSVSDAKDINKKIGAFIKKMKA